MGKQFAHYWIYNGMLQLGGEKMSKSLGNIVSIKEFLSKRDADVMRMLVLNGSYRVPLIFNDETLDAAEKSLERIKSGLRPAAGDLRRDFPPVVLPNSLLRNTKRIDNPLYQPWMMTSNTAGIGCVT